MQDGNIKFIILPESKTKDIGVNKLLKFKRIEDYIKEENPDFDYFCFIQSNARCQAKIELAELT